MDILVRLNNQTAGRDKIIRLEFTGKFYFHKISVLFIDNYLY